MKCNYFSSITRTSALSMLFGKSPRIGGSLLPSCCLQAPATLCHHRTALWGGGARVRVRVCGGYELQRRLHIAGVCVRVCIWCADSMRECMPWTV
jgi:hypothetical protein